MTSEKLFPEVSALGLNWKVAEYEFDRKSGVVRLRIEETEQSWRKIVSVCAKEFCENKKPNKCVRIGCRRHPSL
jgi:hypothetical protein